MDKKLQTAMQLGALAIASASTLLAFNRNTRKEILERDKFTCQHPDCTRSFYAGWHIQAAHYPDLHGTGDDDPECGRVLCTGHHIVEELLRGNEYGAKKLYMSQTVRNYDYIFKHSGQDQKPPFGFYIRAALALKAGKDLIVEQDLYVEA